MPALETKYPGVYVKEISTLPPSVAAVSTAIPAFLGYTEKSPGSTFPHVATVRTLLEYEDLFGKAVNETINLVNSSGVLGANPVPAPKFLMYYAVSHYFLNGGGLCYIVSLGGYAAGKPLLEDFKGGLAELKKEDEPTLILLTDAVNLSTPTEYYTLCQLSLDQCNELGNRFCIFDILRDVSGDANRGVEGFRNGPVSNYLKYGAAYHPYLQTSLTVQYADETVTVDGVSPVEPKPSGKWTTTVGDPNGIKVKYTGVAKAPSLTFVEDQSATPPIIDIDSAGGTLTIKFKKPITGTEVITAWTKISPNRTRGFAIEVVGDSATSLDFPGSVQLVDEDPKVSPLKPSLKSIETSHTEVYQKAKAALAALTVTLPPSAAVAGIYASVDRERGVWKAPANVGVSAVIGPVVKITDKDQERLNIDPTSGKSINAIRAFAGKGTLVWGARTLLGNDNEWRYVPVRRLFSFIEESSRKATAFAVFEPNDLTTWLKVKGMIESFLYGLWEQGALAGSTPDKAYFVNVGLGKTMTVQNVLEGQMIVEIGAAAVRPAEFIILRFTHKLQQA
jgi:uncharacterized protein